MRDLNLRLAASANTEVDLLSLFAVPLLSTTTKYIATNYKVDIVKLGPHLKKALKAGVEKKRPLLEGIVSPCHQHFKGLPKDQIIEKEVANLLLRYGSDSLNRRPRPHTKQDCKEHKVVPPTPRSQWIHKVVNLAFYVKTGQELLKSFSHLGDYNLSYSTQYLYVRTPCKTKNFWNYFHTFQNNLFNPLF